MWQNTFKLLLILLVANLAFFIGCTTATHQQTIVNQAYREALATPGVNLPIDAPEAQAMLARVTNLFANYTAENLRTNIPKVYAHNLYFRDAFKHLSTATELQHYLLEGLAPVRTCTFTFTDIARSNDNYYLQWTMHIALNSDPEGHLTQSIGMSHLRFNNQGQVIFHQDYWDPSDLLYTRIPIANRLIAHAKNRL